MQFWDIAPCSPLKVNWRFEGACRLLKMEATRNFKAKNVLSFISRLPRFGPLPFLSLSSMPRENQSVHWLGKRFPSGSMANTDCLWFHLYTEDRLACWKRELCIGSPKKRDSFLCLYLLTYHTYSNGSDVTTQINREIFHSHKTISSVWSLCNQYHLQKKVIWNFQWLQWVFVWWWILQ
jgi:hypothetical protein